MYNTCEANWSIVTNISSTAFLVQWSYICTLPFFWQLLVVKKQWDRSHEQWRTEELGEPCTNNLTEESPPFLAKAPSSIPLTPATYYVPAHLAGGPTGHLASARLAVSTETKKGCSSRWLKSKPWWI